MSHDFLSFFIAWIAAPGRVGAIAPSGDALAELITREIGPATGPVIELGPGTGAFTYKLLKRGVRPEELTLIEYGSDFVRKLQLRFPGARVLWMDASRLRGDRLYDSDVVGAVVSGLPLLNMSTREVMSVLEGAFSYMRPGGAFYQFTYGMRCPVRRPILDRLGLKATLVDRAMLNVAASGTDSPGEPNATLYSERPHVRTQILRHSPPRHSIASVSTYPERPVRCSPESTRDRPLLAQSRPSTNLHALKGQEAKSACS